MTNKEAYLDKILASFIDNYCHKIYEIHFGKKCHGNKCNDCKFFNVDTISEWLKEEWKEPEPELLENGDGLKPGDWIMVSNHGTGFCKRQFLFFHNGLFYTTVNNDDISLSGNYTSWKLARLPEDGE